MIRTGIIGLGTMGTLHGKLLQQNAQVEIAGVADVDPAKVRTASELFSCPGHATAGALLAGGLDLAFITVPNTKHATLACAALERGIDVFVEKPLATSLADARRVAAAQRKSGRRLFVGYNRRFAPVYREAKRIVDDAAFRPTHLNMIQNDGDMRDPPWLTDVTMTGGFMYDTTVHFLDMARYLLGEIVEIRALGKGWFYPIPDDFVVQLRFASGAYGTITTCGHASWISPFERVQVVGDHRSVITEELDELRCSPCLGAVVEGRNYSKLPHNDKWGYAAMHGHLFEVLGEATVACLNGLSEGLRGVELIEACHRSAAGDGQIIRLGTETIE
jgi:myo-inositol 2-dehydrogenase/D-chiro-inositol 1-dehydrogenase